MLKMCPLASSSRILWGVSYETGSQGTVGGGCCVAVGEDGSVAGGEGGSAADVETGTTGGLVGRGEAVVPGNKRFGSIPDPHANNAETVASVAQAAPMVSLPLLMIYLQFTQVT
jgi:hypothetical protein